VGGNWGCGCELGLWVGTGAVGVNWGCGWELGLWVGTGNVGVNWGCGWELYAKPQHYWKLIQL